jgi:hypothetical protein
MGQPSTVKETVEGMRRFLNLTVLLPTLAIVAIGFAIWGWHAQADALNLSWLDVLYHSLHAVTLSNLYAFSERYNQDWRIETARVLGAIAFVVAATKAVLALLSTHASRMFGRYRRGHLLVVGDHGVARGVTEAAAARAATVTWISNSEEEALPIPGALIVPKRWEPSLAASFAASHASRAVVAFRNEVQQVAAVRALRAVSPHLPIVMNFADAWFAERMDELENIQGVRFVSQVQLSVRALHWRIPPFLIARRLGHRRMHALIFGLGRGGEAVLTDLLLSSLTSFLGKPRVTIVDPRAREIRASLFQRCPGLSETVDIEVIDPELVADVRLLPTNALALAQAEDPFTLAYVAIDEDLRAMALAVSLQAVARREGWAMGPIFTRLVHGGALPEVPEEGEVAGLVQFGATADFAAAIGLFDPDFDALPQMFHEAYRRTAPADAPANIAWERLPEEFRESNRRQLVHLPAKLASAGVDVAAWLRRPLPPTSATGGIPLPSLETDPDLLERLAELEHRRWMMDRTLSGWRPGPARDNARRIHPDLKPYAELTEATRELDRAIVREAWTALGSDKGSGFFPDGGWTRETPELRAAAE